MKVRVVYYLRDGGYYFALSDYMDLALTGEIYTKGSLGTVGSFFLSETV